MTILALLLALYLGGLAVYVAAMPYIALARFSQGQPWPIGKRTTAFYPVTLVLLRLSSNKERWTKIQDAAKS